MKTPHSFLTPVFVALLLLTCGADRAGDASGRPNVLLITMDTTRADRIGCYGYERGTTPVLDRLALESVRYTRAFSTAGITPVAHASILTGLFPYQHGARVMFGTVEHRLGDAHPTLATRLRDEGWRTGAFVSAYPASEEFGLDRGFETFDSGVRDELRDEFRESPPRREGLWLDQPTADAQRRADPTIDRAVDWITNGSAPFFAWVHLFDPHDHSLVPPAGYLERFGVPTDGSGTRDAIYDPEVFFMDAQIGRLLEMLRATGRYDDTIVIVTSDHGQGLGDHGWFQHRLLYQEQIHVPLIVKPHAPMSPAPGVRDEIVRVTDIYPTVLALAGVDRGAAATGAADPIAPRTLPGMELPARAGGANRTASDRRIAYAEALIPLDAYSNPRLPKRHWDNLHVVVDGPWKLIYHALTPANSELYHLEDDPAESRNRFEREQEVRDRLVAALRATGALTIETKPGAGEAVDPEAERKLRSLGYIGG